METRTETRGELRRTMSRVSAFRSLFLVLLLRYDIVLVFYNTVRCVFHFFFFFSSRRRHTRFDCDWSSDVCSSDLAMPPPGPPPPEGEGISCTAASWTTVRAE